MSMELLFIEHLDNTLTSHKTFQYNINVPDAKKSMCTRQNIFSPKIGNSATFSLSSKNKKYISVDKQFSPVYIHKM